MSVRRVKPTIIILDDNKERCLREEQALDRAIADNNIFASGMSNYGSGFLHRSGVPKEKFPCLDVEGLFFFPPRPNEELTYDIFCVFLNMLVEKNVLRLNGNA